jgi:TolA-binding protein
MKTKLLLLLFLAGCLLSTRTTAQQTLYFQSENQQVQEARELYQKNKYASALQRYEELAGNPATSVEIKSEAEFYKAMCAVKLDNRNAEQVVEKFISNNPESPYLNRARFELAGQQFDNKKYGPALRSLSDIDRSQLSKDELARYYYQTGYANFELEKYDPAEAAFAEIKDGKSMYADPARYYWAHIHYLKGNYETALKEFQTLKENPAFAKVIPYYISQIYYKQQKYQEVVSYAAPLLEKAETKQKPELAKMIGDSYFHLRDFQNTIPYLEYYFTYNGNKGREENYMLGYCYYLNNQEQKAIPYLENASKGNDELAQNAYYHLADCYISANDKNKARQAFQAASEMDFDAKIKEDALFNFAKITYELSYSPFNETIKAFDKYIASYPNSERNDDAYNYLVKVYMSTSNYRDAMASIENIKVKTPAVKKAYQRVSFYRALEYFNNLDYQSAIACFEKSQAAGDFNSNYATLSEFWKAEAWYRLGDYNKAISGYNKFMRTSGAYSLPEYKTAHYDLGYAYFKQKDYASAATWFRKYLDAAKAERTEKVADAWNRLGDCAFVARDYPTAISCYENSQRMNLFDPDYALFQKAFCLGITQRDQQQKISNLRNLIQQYPKSAFIDDALYELGRAYERIDQKQAAINSYNELATNYPQSSYLGKAWVQLGLIYYNSNDFQNSNKYYKQVVERFPNTAEAQAALIGIKNNYVELNDVDSYFSYADKLGSGIQVSVTEQDSLSYLSAEKLFMAGDKKAKAQFERYISQFPTGSFMVNARFYRGECRYNDREYATALTDYEYVIAQPENIFTEPALAKASELKYNAGDYKTALTYYTRLEKVANTKWNLLKARSGEMRCYYNLNDYARCADAAKLLLTSDKVTDELKREANYMLAQSYYQTNKINEALPVFGELAQDTRSVEGAEAKYRVAEILYRQKKFDAAENEIMDYISKNTPHQFWLANSFILLSDIYLQKGDGFQAKHTLKSLIDNYSDQTDGIQDMARQRLQQIEAREQQQVAPAEKPIEININPKKK